MRRLTWLIAFVSLAVVVAGQVVWRCPTAVATGTLHDPYTNAVVAFTRGNQIGAAVQVDHIESAAVAPEAAIDAGQHVKVMPLTSLEAQP